MSRKLIVALVALATLLAACGTRTDGSEESSGDLGPTPSPQPSDDTGESAAETFGTAAIPCRDADTSGYPEQSDQGVTRDTIRIGTIADPGGMVPGLNQGMFDTMAAFADWCNELGGINGRKLEVDFLDAKLTEYKERVLEACEVDFALVGGLGVFDNTGAQDQVDCELPFIPGASVSAEALGADFSWHAIPNPPDKFRVGPGRWVAEEFPGVSAKAGMIEANVPSLIDQADRQRAAYEQIGYEFVAHERANIGESNWAPIALKLKNAGVEHLVQVSAYEEALGLRKALNEQGYEPTVHELETNYYTNRFPEEAQELGLDLGLTLVRITTWPFEEADEKPAMAEYLRILDEYSSDYDTEPEQLGVQAWSSALMFATAVDALGADVTRAGLHEEMAKITEWDAGGLHGTTNPAEDIPTECFVMMRIVDGGFERYYPLPDEHAEVYEAGDGFACPEQDNYVDLPEFGGKGATASG